MNHQTRIPPRHVPTLTEVVEIVEAVEPAEPLPDPGAVVDVASPLDMPEAFPSAIEAGPVADAPPVPEPLAPLAAASPVSEPEPAAGERPAPEPLPVTPAPFGQDDAVPAFLRARPAPHLASALGTIERAESFEAANEMEAPAPQPEPAAVSAEAFEPAAAALDDASVEQIAQRVLADLQRQIDLMLEYRLREALAPILARAADGIVKEARRDLATTLKDVVSRAVAQELARQRLR